MTDKRHSIAMVGLGQWGPNLLRVLRESPRADVQVICDANTSRLAEFAPLHPGARLATSFAEVLSSDVPTVVLATPAGTHEALVEQALMAGKDVFVEKPLALSGATAARLVGLARLRGAVLMAGHTFLFNPAVLKAGELIRAGALGRVRHVLAQRLSLGQIREDVNALWNLAPHDVSILLSWLGEIPTRVSAHGQRSFGASKQEDVVLATLEFPSGVLASIQVSWLAPTKVRAMLVVGSDQMLRYDDTNAHQPLTLYHRGATEVPRTAPDGTLEGFRLQVRQGGEETVAVSTDEPLKLEMAHFMDCLESRREPVGSGRDAIAITAVLEALDQSVKRGGAAVELPHVFHGKEA